MCTNPDFYERNQTRWRCKLIPNGIDCERFKPGPGQRERFGLPPGPMTILMVSALIPTKRVELGIETVSRIPDAHLVVAGNRAAAPGDCSRRGTIAAWQIFPIDGPCRSDAGALSIRRRIPPSRQRGIVRKCIP